MGATVFTGPVLSGNVLQSDGTGNLATDQSATGGTQNVGFVEMVQSAPVTQAKNGSNAAGVYTTTIVIPARSRIQSITLTPTTAWDGVSKLLGIGSTASATTFTVAADVDGATIGNVAAAPGANATQIANWLDVGVTDVQVKTTSVNTGAGVGVLTVRYAQAFNAFSGGNYT